MREPTLASGGNLYGRLMLRAVFFAVCALLLVYAVPWLFSMTAPFMFAYLMAYMLNPVVDTLRRKARIPRRPLALLLVALVFSVVLTCVGWLIRTAISEAVSLATNYQSIWDSLMSVVDFVNEKLDFVVGILPDDAQNTFDSLSASVYQWLQTVSRQFLNFILTYSRTLPTKIGSFVMSIMIFFIAAYFMTAEYQVIGRFIRKHLGGRVFGFLHTARLAVKSAVGGYLKAQLLLALLAFVVMFPALLLYGQPYALLIALLLALIDFLPIIGTAILLIPWGIVAMIGGDIVKGIFLIALAAAFFVLRKIMEPRIVGSQTGLHPLAALMSIYIGMKVAGVWGAILGPIAVMIAISLVKAGMFDNTVLDLREASDDIARRMRRGG